MSEESRKAEAQGKTTAELEFRGQTFTVPTEYDDLTLDFLESVEEGKSAGIIRGALGPQQWRQVKAMNLSIREANELADKIAVALGFASAGESEASSD